MCTIGGGHYINWVQDISTCKTPTHCYPVTHKPHAHGPATGPYVTPTHCTYTGTYHHTHTYPLHIFPTVVPMSHIYPFLPLPLSLSSPTPPPLPTLSSHTPDQYPSNVMLGDLARQEPCSLVAGEVLHVQEGRVLHVGSFPRQPLWHTAIPTETEEGSR